MYIYIKKIYICIYICIYSLYRSKLGDLLIFSGTREYEQKMFLI
jgi:hypothetical protein